MEKKLTVVYDDKCPMCTVGMNVVDALDDASAIDLVGMNSERGRELVAEHGLDMNASAYAIRTDGTRSEKVAFMRDILSHNGAIGSILSLPFRLPFVGNALYDLLAFIRYHTTASKVDGS